MLGESFNNNEKKENSKRYNPTVTSEYKMSNPEGVDPSALTFSYWNGLLNIKIAPKKDQNPNEEFASYDYDKAASAFISHSKARVLANEIKRFIEAKGSISNVGINIKHGLLSICDGKEFAVNGPCLVMLDLDPRTGVVNSKSIYQFKTGYHYGIENFDQETSKYDTYNYDYLELEQFLTILEQFYLAMTNSIAYSVINTDKYNQNRIKNDLDSIKENLGIADAKPNYSSKSGGSYFNRNNNSTSSSYEDIQNKIASMEE